MFLKEIFLNNVRVFSDLRTEFNPKINIIHGKNGQGKTSILEAIYYICITKSFRINRDDVVLKEGCAFFDIKGVFLNESDREIHSRIYYSSSEGKHAFLNSQKVKQFSEIVGQFPVILLSLDDLELTFGVPAARRKFLDILLSQLFPGYLQNLRNYKKCISQKNKLLNSDEMVSDKDISIWNEQIINYGSDIVYQRNRFVQFANQQISLFYKKISDKSEHIEIKYNSSVHNSEADFQLEKIKESFKKTLQKNTESEQKRRTSLIGPHKDDLDFLKNGFLFKSHGSQGENKSFLMALKTVESIYIKQVSHKKPLFLLDDIFGELDASRIENLVHLINDEGQTFITTTDPEKFKNIFPENSKLIFLKDHSIQ